MRRHFRAAYLVAFARMTNRADAEDICQDAFVRAWRNINDCRAPERFGAWLVQIVRNTAHNRADYLRVRSTEPEEHGLHVASEAASDDSTLRGELRDTLLAALAQLSPVQREIVLMHDLEGWKHGEIAARMDVSEAMSRRHLSDARRRLRSILGDYATLGSDHD